MTIKQECCWYVFVFYKRFVLILFCLCICDVFVGGVYCGIGCSCCKPSTTDTAVNGGNNKNHNNQDNNNDEDKKEDDDAEQQQIEKQFKDNLKAFNEALDKATNNVYDVKNNGFLIISVERCDHKSDYTPTDEILTYVADYVNKRPKELTFLTDEKYKDLFKFVIFSEYCLQDKYAPIDKNRYDELCTKLTNISSTHKNTIIYANFLYTKQEEMSKNDLNTYLLRFLSTYICDMMLNDAIKVSLMPNGINIENIYNKMNTIIQDIEKNNFINKIEYADYINIIGKFSNNADMQKNIINNIVSIIYDRLKVIQLGCINKLMEFKKLTIIDDFIVMFSDIYNKQESTTVDILENKTIGIHHREMLTQYNKSTYFKECDNILKDCLYKIGDMQNYPINNNQDNKIQQFMLNNITHEICMDAICGIDYIRSFNNTNNIRLHIIQSDTISAFSVKDISPQYIIITNSEKNETIGHNYNTCITKTYFIDHNKCIHFIDKKNENTLQLTIKAENDKMYRVRLTYIEGALQ